MPKLSVGLIGLGAIGSVLAEGLSRDAQTPLMAVLVRPARLAEAKAMLPTGVRLVTRLADLLELGPDLVVECAGQEAMRLYAEETLSSGIDLMVVSTGALAAEGMLERVEAAARLGGARLLIPAGAIAGLDGLGALKAAGLTAVTYISEKPPLAWRGTKAEEVLDLEGLQERTVFFDGTAREAALAYPKNANLAATVALAGLGLDRTRVRLVANPATTGNTGMIEAESEIGDMRLAMAGRASANPKTSASTAYSLLHAVRSQAATIVI